MSRCSFLVGFGDNPPTHAQNPAASCPAEPQPCTNSNNYISSAPDVNTLKGALVEGPSITGTDLGSLDIFQVKFWVITYLRLFFPFDPPTEQNLWHLRSCLQYACRAAICRYPEAEFNALLQVLGMSASPLLPMQSLDKTLTALSRNRSLNLRLVQDSRPNNDTRVPIQNNAGLAGVVASMQDAPGTWEQCLQGYGIFNKARNLC